MSKSIRWACAGAAIFGFSGAVLGADVPPAASPPMHHGTAAASGQPAATCTP